MSLQLLRSQRPSHNSPAPRLVAKAPGAPGGHAQRRLRPPHLQRLRPEAHGPGHELLHELRLQGVQQLVADADRLPGSAHLS